MLGEAAWYNRSSFGFRINRSKYGLSIYSYIESIKAVAYYALHGFIDFILRFIEQL